MKSMKRGFTLAGVVVMAVASMASADQLIPLTGGAVSEPPPNTDTVKMVNTNTVAPDAKALADLSVQEKALIAQFKELGDKISALYQPLWAARQRYVSTDPDLQAMTKAIAAKQKELEAKLIENHPDLAAKIKESNELIRQHSELQAKLRGVRKNMDEIELAINKQAADKKASR